jgi:hypothetical protein
MKRAVLLWVAAALASFVGCAADAQETTSDPLADVGALKNVQFVMKYGVVFKSAVGMGHAP